MSFSLSSLVRLIVVMALGSSMLAIGLSRLDPPKPASRTRFATKYINLNEYFMNFADRTPRWLDAETCQISPAPLEDNDVLEAASCTPWKEEKGQYQVAGRWSRRTKMGPLSISTDFGLARYSFPGGQLLDHLSTEIVPVGPPCWFPGTRARILFAGGDGELYHYAFEADPDEKQINPAAHADIDPIQVRWRCPKPGLGKVFLSDLSWPEDPRLNSFVVVSLREQSPDSEVLRSFTGSTLWWLKLDFAGTEIIEGGRMLLPDTEHCLDTTQDQRCPTLGTLSDGKPVVAYLTEGLEKQGWELRIAPIEFDDNRHVPKVHESRSVLLSHACQPAQPSFSSDGLWLNAIAESSEVNGRVIRLPIDKAFSPSK